MVLSAIICGHSFCKRLQVDMQAGTDTRMRPSFKLEETARVQMLGKGGKTIGDFVRRDIPVIQRYRPDILILLLGDNDIGCDTSAEEIANHLIALASQLYMSGHVSRIVLCQMMPRSRAPLAAQRRTGGVTRKNADTRIFIVRATGTGGQSSAKRSSKFVSFLTFWDHNKKFRFIEHGQSQEGKSAADGIHLAPRGQYQLYKSLRGALLCWTTGLPDVACM